MTGMLHAWTKVRLMRLDPRLVVLKRQLETPGWSKERGRGPFWDHGIGERDRRRCAGAWAR